MEIIFDVLSLGKFFLILCIAESRVYLWARLRNDTRSSGGDIPFLLYALVRLYDNLRGTGE